MMRRLLYAWARLLSDPRIIYGRDGQDEYLVRYYLIGDRTAEEADLIGHEAPVRERYFNLFLHRFVRSDDDGALHSHPWSWAVSLVLVGGYREERRVGDEVVSRIVRPWSLNFLRGEDYHRVDLLEEDAWSLFLVGPKVSTWWFFDRHTRMRSQWRKFINAKRYGTDAGWEPDSRVAA